MIPFKPEIFRVFDCSTAHITLGDNDRLAEAVRHGNDDGGVSEMFPLIVYGYKEGYFLYVNGGEEAAQIMAAGFSADLCGLIRLARKLGCKLINFDSDGPVYDQLPQHDYHTAGRVGTGDWIDQLSDADYEDLRRHNALPHQEA